MSKGNNGQENIRLLVLESLLLTDKGQKCSEVENAVLEKYAYLPKRDRAFYQRLFEGVLEKKITLDWRIDAYSSTKTKKMKPAIRQILRMAVYQMTEMDAVPEAAAVNEAVRLAGMKGFSSLKGFVNGVLRSMARDPEKVTWPDRADPVRYLSVKYSVGEILAKGILDEYGPETAETVFSAMEEPRPLTVRIRGNAEKVLASLKEEGVTASRITLAENAWKLENVDSLTRLTAFRKGEIAVMDAASILCVESAGIKPGMRILDLCAAPGGKSCMAADLTGREGRVYSRDISERKAGLIRENAERFGLENLEISVHDAACYDETLKEGFDLVLADVPCSGYGVMGRKPDIKYRAEAYRQEALRTLQRQILSCAARYVKPGGTLLYSTCTLGKYENDENADWFAAEFPDFSPAGRRQLLPGRDEADGFFTARFVKR